MPGFSSFYNAKLPEKPLLWCPPSPIIPARAFPSVRLDLHVINETLSLRVHFPILAEPDMTTPGSYPDPLRLESVR